MLNYNVKVKLCDSSDAYILVKGIIAVKKRNKQ